MKAKKILAAVTALSLTTVVFASCGDSADSSSSTAAATTTTAAAESAADSAATDSSADTTKGSDSDYTPVKTFKGYDAFLMFGDGEWLWGNWDVR